MYDIFFCIRDFDSIKREIRSRYPFAKFHIADKDHNFFDALKSCQKRSMTKMFWFIDLDYTVKQDFSFDYLVEPWDDVYLHIFKNQKVCLVPKSYEIPDNEFLQNTKNIDLDPSVLISMDIFFISYEEPNAEKNWKILSDRFPKAKRIQNVKGIHQAHIEAATQSTTGMLWVVDGDAEILETFNFDCELLSHYDLFFKSVHVFQSKNPINDLVYGYGGVKLLPRELTLEMDTSRIDMTTSISPYFISVPVVSNITAFNTDPFSTWKSAFRECAKLSAKIINNQKDEETDHRLEIWCTKGRDRLFGEYAVSGAISGKTFGLKNGNNIDTMSKINDWEWLKNEFNKL